MMEALGLLRKGTGGVQSTPRMSTCCRKKICFQKNDASFYERSCQDEPWTEDSMLHPEDYGESIDQEPRNCTDRLLLL